MGIIVCNCESETKQKSKNDLIKVSPSKNELFNTNTLLIITRSQLERCKSDADELGKILIIFYGKKLDPLSKSMVQVVDKQVKHFSSNLVVLKIDAENSTELQQTDFDNETIPYIKFYKDSKLIFSMNDLDEDIIIENIERAVNGEEFLVEIDFKQLESVEDLVNYRNKTAKERKILVVQFYKSDLKCDKVMKLYNKSLLTFKDKVVIMKCSLDFYKDIFDATIQQGDKVINVAPVFQVYVNNAKYGDIYGETTQKKITNLIQSSLEHMSRAKFNDDEDLDESFDFDGGNCVRILNTVQFEKYKQESIEGKPLIIMFYKSKDKTCAKMMKYFDEFSIQYNNLIFVKSDAEKVDYFEAAMSEQPGLNEFPIIQSYDVGDMSSMVYGIDIEGLRNLVEASSNVANSK